LFGGFSCRIRHCFSRPVCRAQQCRIFLVPEISGFSL